MKLTLVLVVMLVSMVMPTVTLAQEDDDLTGIVWQLVAYGDAVDAQTTDDVTRPVTLIFNTAEKFSGFGGCNNYGGAYTLDGDTFTAQGIYSTLMACVDVDGNGDASMELEQRYLDALNQALRYELRDAHLVIAYGDGEELVFKPSVTLTGTQWRLVSYGDFDAPSDVLAEAEITLTFDADSQTVSGSGGCNRYHSAYTLNDETITFDGVVSTEMACLIDGVMEQEQAYHAALAGAVSYWLTSDGQLLIDYGDDQQLVFEQVVTLEDTSWELVAYGAVDAPQSVVGTTPLTLMFMADGRVSGYAGCNTFGSTFTVDDAGSLQIDDAFSTRRACLEEALMTQETTYLTALAQATGFTLSADQLIIDYGDGMQLVFKPFDDAATAES